MRYAFNNLYFLIFIFKKIIILYNQFKNFFLNFIYIYLHLIIIYVDMSYYLYLN
jgi:hypothetical protein